MSLSIDQTRQLVADELPSGIPDNIGAVNMRTSVLAVIDLLGSGSFSNLAYDDQTVYDKDTEPYAEQLERLWKATQDDFSGIAPPTDPDVTSNFNWIEVSQAGGSAIVEHQVGAYGEGLQIVLGTVDGNRVLVELLNPSRPFESANLQTEFDGGDWGIVGEPPGAGGIPEAPIDGQQYARKDAGWEVVAGGGGIALTDIPYPLDFQVHSDSPTSDWAIFKAHIDIDDTSEVLDSDISSAAYETSDDGGATTVIHTNIAALKIWVDANITLATDVFQIRTTATYSGFGSGNVKFKYKIA